MAIADISVCVSCKAFHSGVNMTIVLRNLASAVYFVQTYIYTAFSSNIIRIISLVKVPQGRAIAPPF